MAINPEYWRRARDETSIHLQMRIKALEKHYASGPVVRIFRDRTGRLKVGDPVRFEVSVRPRPDSSSEPMPGRQYVGLEEEWLRVARFLEAYLEPDLHDGYHVAWDQATALLRSTKEPVNPPGGELAYGVLVTDEVIERARHPYRKSWWARLFGV